MTTLRKISCFTPVRGILPALLLATTIHAATTLHVWQANTNPTNELSYFRIDHIDCASNGTPATVYFQTSSNRQYTLFHSSTLSSPWTSVPGQTAIPGTGGMDSLTDTNSAPHQFYRVGVDVACETCPYFPMAVGNQWTYAPGYGDGPRIDTITGKDVVNGTCIYTWERLEASPDDYHEVRKLAGNGGGLQMFEIWGNEGLEFYEVVNAPVSLIPSSPLPGQSWQGEVRGSVGSTQGTILINLSVQSTNATITVTAGTFTNCLVVRQHVEITFEGSPTEHEYTEYWFAPGVGMVSDKDYEANWSQVKHSEDLVEYTLK